MIYLITTGSYSDWTIHGVYEGPDGLDLIQAREEFEPIRIQLEREYEFDISVSDKFHKWLVKKFSLKRLDNREWWISEGGCLESVECVKEANLDKPLAQGYDNAS